MQAPEAGGEEPAQKPAQIAADRVSSQDLLKNLTEEDKKKLREQR